MPYSDIDTMQPLISVIIPCYNAAAFIEQTLASVYAQTYKNIEVVCVDINSNDDTIEIINRLKHQNNWDLILLQEKRQGAPHARNLGLEYAGGTYIQFLDSDDFLVKDKLQKQATWSLVWQCMQSHSRDPNSIACHFRHATAWLKSVEGRGAIASQVSKHFGPSATFQAEACPK